MPRSLCSFSLMALLISGQVCGFVHFCVTVILMLIWPVARWNGAIWAVPRQSGSMLILTLLIFNWLRLVVSLFRSVVLSTRILGWWRRPIKLACFLLPQVLIVVVGIYVIVTMPWLPTMASPTLVLSIRICVSVVTAPVFVIVIIIVSVVIII